MKMKGNCQTTAMGILPHKDIDQAMKIAFSVDIPFWPQLPHVNIYEDMYVQVTENFPGITVDDVNEKIIFDTARFYEELPTYVENYDNDDFYRIAGKYSAVYHTFLNDQRLKEYPVIRGQSIGPVSFGLKIADENKKPIIYNDEVRGFLYEFLAKKINVQWREIAAINPDSFVWIDEPGLSFIFGSFTGYPSEVAKKDYREFLAQLEGPKGVHLCGNPDWSFLLEMDLDILSIDTLSNGTIFIKYLEQIKQFLDRGGIISWGIVPTLTEEFDQESVDSLILKLEEMWDYLEAHGIPKKQVLSQAWIAPARCCLVNMDGNNTVEKAFEFLNKVSRQIRTKYNLD
jgi:hypothetical protein